MSRIIILFFLLISGYAKSQDTISVSSLIYTDGKYHYQNLPYSGIAKIEGLKYHEYYRYCTGEICGYMAFFENGDTAGVHTYNGDLIHLVFYTQEGKKTLEYYQKKIDQTYTYGEWKDYRDDGTLMVKGNYDLIKVTIEGRGGTVTQWKPVRDGVWEYYDETGKCTKREIWRKDKLIRNKSVD